MTTAYDKIADSFIAANKSLEDLPVRRAAKRRQEEERRRREAPAPRQPVSVPTAQPAPVTPGPFASRFLQQQPGPVPTPPRPLDFLDDEDAIALRDSILNGPQATPFRTNVDTGAAVRTGLDAAFSPFSFLTQISRPALAVNPAFSAFGEQTPVDIDAYGAERGYRGDRGLYERSVIQEQGQNILSQAVAGALTDPTVFPVGGGAKRAVQAGLQAIPSVPIARAATLPPGFLTTLNAQIANLEKILAVKGRLPREFGTRKEALTSLGAKRAESFQAMVLGSTDDQAVAIQQIQREATKAGREIDNRFRAPFHGGNPALYPEFKAAELEGYATSLDNFVRQIDELPAVVDDVASPVPVEETLAPRTSVQGGFDIGEPPQQVGLDIGGRGAPLEPLIPPEQVAAQARRAEEASAGQQVLPESVPDVPLAAAPPSEPPNVPPVATAGAEPEPGDAAGYIEWFRRFLSDPKRIEDWDVTLQQRREVLASRASGVESAVNQLIDQGHSSEDAIRLARASLSGELPTATTGIREVVTPTIRQALFDEVRLVLADEPFEMISTHEALTNALMGRAIPRTPGTAGGSAFSRLSRVFGEEITEALARRQTLDEVITFQAGQRGSQTTMGGRVPPPGSRPNAEPGVQNIQPSSQQFGDARVFGPLEGHGTQIFGEPTPRLIGDEVLADPQVPLSLESPPGPFDPSIRNPRTVGEQEVDLETFRQTIGDVPQTGTPGVDIPAPNELALRDPQRPILPESPPGPFPERIKVYQSPGQRAKKAEDFKRAIDAVTALPEETYDRMIRWAKNFGLTAQDFGNLLRANMASVDLSYIRQQAFLIPGNPVKFAKSFPEALKALWSDDYAKAVENGIRNDPLYAYYQRGLEGAQQTDLARGLGQIVPSGRSGADFLRTLDSPEAKAWDVEEQFQVLAGTRPLQRLANKLPWLNISNRAFITGINHMNWSIYKGHMQTLLRNNEQVAAGNIRNRIGGKRTHLSETDIRKSMNAASKLLADMSARGPLGPLREMSPALNAGFFSLRSTIGRLISPRHMISRDPFVRSAAWKNLLTAIGAYSSFIFAGQQMGLWDVETDPRSSDFMKIRLAGGRLTIDIWGGHQQYAVLYGRLLPLVGGVKSVQTGAISDYDPVTGITRFARNKASPLLSKALTIWTGKDFRGQEIDRRDWKRWLKESAQLSVQDVMESYGAMGLVGLFAGIPSGVFGFGVTGRPLTRNDKSLEMYGISYDDLPLGNKKLGIPDRRKRVRQALGLDLSEEEKAKEEEKKNKQQDRRDAREFERRGNFPRVVEESGNFSEIFGSVVDTVKDRVGSVIQSGPASGVEATPNEMTPAERAALMEFYRESGSRLSFDDWFASVRR